MDYILLRLTARLTHSPLPFWRALCGAGTGALSALLILLPPLHPLLSLLCKAGAGLLICLAAFGHRRLLWKLMAFYGLSCALAGICLGLSLLGAEICCINGTWYPSISLRQLVLCTIAAYLVLTLLQRLQERSGKGGDYTVILRQGETVLRLEGIADTGNALVDFYTGRPVIICSKEAVSTILPERLRPLPCTTVAGEGVLLCFTPDEVILTHGRLRKSVEVLIGITETPQSGAVFHPRLLNC